MKKNGVKPDLQTHALLFSKNLHLKNIDQANLNLKRVIDSPAHPFSIIPTNDLK